MDANSQAYKYYPAGCFRHTVSGKFYWNTHGSGASSSFAQPLCAGAPATHRRRNTCLIIWYSVVLSAQAELGYSVALASQPRMGHEKRLSAGPAATLPTFSSSGAAAP
jgi:hypothetical protein